MKIAILLVMIPLAILFSCIGFFIFVNKIDFQDNGIEYVKDGVIRDTKSVNNSGISVRRLCGITLIICAICMVLLPVVIL